MASLDTSLQDHLLTSDRPIVAEQLWGRQKLPRHEFLEEEGQLDTFFEIYFKYYAEQCDIIGNGKYSSVETHSDIMEIERRLRQPLSREEMHYQMSDFLRDADEEQHENSINLVARLLLMIKFGDLPHECGGGRSVKWTSGTLSEFVHGYFSGPPAYTPPAYSLSTTTAPASTPPASTPPVCTHRHIRLEKQFNALNLHRIA
jgi:hypothetical protein